MQNKAEVRRMKLIFGLGNPGKEYESTRHNCGFMTLDRLSEKYGIKISDSKLFGICGSGIIDGEKVMLIKPLTYMNRSGICVKSFMNYYKVNPEDVIIIYDDIDLAPGQLRIRKQGTAGSHNGMKSVVEYMGTTEFPRVRVGVGSKPERWDLKDYVLADVRKDADVMKGIERASEAVAVMLSDGLSEAMSRYNEKIKKPAEEKTENNTAGETAENKAENV